MRNTGNKRKIDTFKIKITVSSRLKTFVCQRVTVNRVKMQPTEWEKMMLQVMYLIRD